MLKQQVSGIRTSMDLKHSITVQLTNSSELRHCLKSKLKVWFSNTFFRMCLKTKILGLNFRQVSEYWISDTYFILHPGFRISQVLYWGLSIY